MLETNGFFVGGERLLVARKHREHVTLIPIGDSNPGFETNGLFIGSECLFVARVRSQEGTAVQLGCPGVDSISVKLRKK